MTIYTNALEVTKRAVLFLGLALSVNVATAGPILNPGGFGSYQINYHEPIGQSFTAQDSFVKASLHYNVINPGWPVDPITLSLYSGFGTGGTLLASDTFTLSAGYDGFFDSDFSSVALTVGNTYSIAASNAGTSPYWGISPGDGDTYSGGSGFIFGNVDVGFDYGFRVTSTTAPVPEPETYAMLLAGLGLIGGIARRRKQQLASA